ncbi:MULTISPECIES: diacylglycerol kinase family protein [unclassified Methylocaldum]|jgi:diacylglycerol kinase family enzyme|uniref:diacylglycerol/lipid kinase family protein n=1 Tax=unclassified Methylocaldum TaxID=2622260 RepID=UPI00098A26F2|nr:MULTISPECIES: diacylglycerol kinase family protein [unclassified Methylocaldum]MBP1152154.1 diacylglycerol kinase family enzyme [Methylocaldum sp. RMAD-M]
MAARLAIIVSTSAGSDEKKGLEKRLEEFFVSRNRDARIWVANSGDEVPDLARRALAENADLIAAGGGDGTINAVASVLAETGKILGVLPLGTLNHFAKDLGIPLDLEQAAQILVDGTPARIDVGEVNGRIFVNNSSLGLYPSIVHGRETLQDRLEYGKWPAFLWASLSVLRRYAILEARLRVDDRELVRHTPFIFVGNNRYQVEGFNIGARTTLDSGWLWLYTTREIGRLGLLRFGLRALLRSLRKDKDFDMMRTKEIVIEARHSSRLRVATDGEVIVMQTPLHYRIRPGALRVIVPNTKVESRGSAIAS